MTHQLPLDSISGSLERSDSPKRPMTASAFSHYPSNGLIRRVASSDCGQLKPPSPSRRAWKVTNDFLEGPRNASDIFRVPSWNNAEKQSRNESSLRFSEGGERQPVVVPQDRLDHAVFRRAADSISMHSPIGTRMEQSAMDNSSIPSIRPSLSCPTTLFESPLFRNHNILASPDGRMDGIRSGENSPGEADDFELNCNNVSGIEYDEEPSFQIDENANLPMRNLNDQFELFVDSTEDMGNIEFEAAESSVKLSTQRNVSKVDFDDSEHKSESKRSDHSTKPSPTSVLEIESKTSPAITTTRLENGVEVASIEMPSFHLHESLKGEVCQGLIDRVSFYSIVRNINKEALDAAMSDPRGHEFNDGSVHGRKGTISNGGNAVVAEDGKVHVHPNPDAESRSVLVAACLAECSSEHSDMFQKPPPLGAALLDEEWWLLGAIAARPPEEVAANQAAELPHTFAEAMGEKDDSSDRNAASSSRTQLWKPGRSWWEAKSGKNPWVEPVVHNNRWRYLWPLIHYHKFIAKCIKKLKRNSVDVKTSTSNVSMFLRQEVCNVSDHLASMSKYDSEEWTSALSHFDGWADSDPDVGEVMRNLVASQIQYGLSEISDLQSSLLRSEVDEKVLKAMQAVKEEAEKAGEDYEYSLGPKDTKARHNSVEGTSAIEQSNYSAQNSSLLNGSYQNPVGTNFPVPRHPNVADRSWSKNKTNNGSGAGFQHPYHHQEIYTPLYDQHHQYAPSHPPGLYGHPPYGAAMNSQYYPHQFEGYNHHPPHIAHNIGYQHGGETGYSMPNHTDQFGHNQFYNGYYPSDGNFHDGMGFDTSIHAAEMNASYMHPSPMAQTPNRYHANELHGQFPVSPYWGHLNISQLPGLAASPSMHHTPSKPPRGNSNRSFRKRQGKAAQMIDGKAKSLIMFPNPNQTNSPASRFVMSPQDKSNPYYANKSHNVPNASSLNQSGHEESFVLPTIEDYSADSPAKAHTSLHSDVSMHLMPPAVKKIYSNSGKKAKESGQ